MPKSPAQQQLQTTIAQAVVPALKALGFRKSGLSWRRRNGQCVQVLSLQSSHGSTAASVRIYINVGLAFDEVCALVGVPVIEKPKTYECEARGFDLRLESLLDATPAHWTFTAQHDAAQAAVLAARITQLAAAFAEIDSLSSWTAHAWFERQRPSGLAAQGLYLAGDHAACRTEVAALCAQFADREPLNTPAWWIDDLHLADLRAAPPSAG